VPLGNSDRPAEPGPACCRLVKTAFLTPTANKAHVLTALEWSGDELLRPPGIKN